MTEAERNAAIEASMAARARNGLLFQRILKDMTADPSEMVTVEGGTQVSKRLLAVRQIQVYPCLLLPLFRVERVVVPFQTKTLKTS